MPTLTGPDGAAYYAAPTSAPTKSTSAASSKPNPNNAKRPPANNNPSSRPALSPSPNDDGSPPSPPPGAPEIQLKMWHAVLVRRKRQMQLLSHDDLLSFANDIIADLLNTRYEANDYSKENRQDGSDKVDLVAGHYSSFLLTQLPPPSDLSADEIGLHLLALFYRSMDDRLPNSMRKHGIDAVRRACERLEFWLAKGEAVQKSSTDLEVTEGSERGGSERGVNSGKRKSMDSVGTGSSNPSSGQPSNTFGDGGGGGRGGNNKKRQPCRFFARGNCAHGDRCWFSHETGGQKDGNNDDQSKSRAENSCRRSTDGDDGSNKRMRKDPPVLNDDSARRVSGMAERPGKVFLPSQPQGGDVQGGDDGEGGKFEKGEHKDPPPVSGSEKRPGKVSLPPQPHQQRLNRNSLEKDKARTNNNHAVPAQQAAVANRKMATDERDKSKKGERNNDHPQPKQSEVRIPKAPGSRQSIGNRFLPPQPTQQGPYETLQLDGSGPSSSNSPFPPQQGPTTTTQNRPQRKDPPPPNQTNGGQRTQTAFMPPQPQQGRKGHSSRKEKSSHPSSSNSASQRMNSNDVISHKQRDVAMAQNEPMGNNERQGNGMNHSIAAEGGRVRHGTEKAKKPKTTAPRTESQKELSPTSNAKNTDTGNESDDDVIDLTCDSPPHESPPSKSPSSVAAKAPSTSNRAIKQCDEESTVKNRTVPQRPPSPPASPLPLATIHNPPPSPQPRPKPFSVRRSLIFDADVNPTASGSLRGRPSCMVSFDAGFHLDGSGSCLNDALCIDVSERLMTWDPYWKIVEELGTRKVPAYPPTQRGHGMTRVGTRTTPCQLDAHRAGPVNPDHPSSCASVSVDLPREISRSKLSNRDSSGKSLGQGYRPWGVRWGSLSHPYTDEKGRQRDRLQTGDRRLIVRTLPLQRTSKGIKKRADGHLWPKGTFLQLEHGDTERVLSILQRKQQSHDLSEWKGMSHPLDLTVEIKNKNMPIELKLCSKEVVENSATNDGAVIGTLIGSYAVHVAICEYVAPDDLYDRLMGKAAGGDVTIPRISLRSARKMAKEYLAGQMVSIEDSDDEDNNSKGDQGKNPEDAKSLTFSLLCPISKTAMHTPVRSRHCKHMQCMDLRVFLHANKNITGGRWRCGACEDFVNVRDLVHCGLFQAMLDSLGSQVSGARDRVSLRSDGNWKLMDENRLRYSKRGGSLSTGTKMEPDIVDSGGKRPSSGPEVIDLV